MLKAYLKYLLETYMKYLGLKYFLMNTSYQLYNVR